MTIGGTASVSLKSNSSHRHICLRRFPEGIRNSNIGDEKDNAQHESVVVQQLASYFPDKTDS